MSKPSLLSQAAALAGWTRDSRFVLGGYVAVMGLVTWFWWPLARDAFVMEDGWNGQPRWHIDWLLAGNFAAMFLLIMAKADWRADAKIALAGLVGGLAIECWGTQTSLWTYYTTERPPLWIIPAWPISSLGIDRLARALDWATGRCWLNESHQCREPDGAHAGAPVFWSAAASEARHRFRCVFPKAPSPLRSAAALQNLAEFRVVYWIVFGSFYVLMLWFVAPTWGKWLTWVALVLCAFIILTPTDYRWATLTFLAGSGLGYFLERWGTTRECWVYYTHQRPPLFAVLGHGMACVGFWRACRTVQSLRFKV